MRLLRWWHRRSTDTTEARTALAEVESRTPEVNRLADEICAARRSNHFSLMVHDAISRARGT